MQIPWNSHLSDSQVISHYDIVAATTWAQDIAEDEY